MLSISVNDSPFPADQPQHLTIARIEVFVIPALAIDANGHRVCLRITSDCGYGWSEQFVGEHEHIFTLEHWRHLLQSFIGRFPLSCLTDRLSERIVDNAIPDNRAYAMFVKAVNAIRFQGIGTANIAAVPPKPAEESVLQQRAVAYLSIE